MKDCMVWKAKRQDIAFKVKRSFYGVRDLRVSLSQISMAAIAASLLRISLLVPIFRDISYIKFKMLEKK